MTTGQLPSATRGYDNAAYLASTIPTFAHYARIAGYRTVLSGKMHFVGPDQLHGFEERRTTDIYPADFGWTPDWRAPDERIDWWYHNMDSVTGAGVAEVTNQLLFDDEVGFHAVRALHDVARAEDRRPFLLVASFTHPHDPYVTRQEYWDRYEGVDIPMPAVSAADVPLDPHTRRLRGACDMERSGDHRRRRATCATCLHGKYLVRRRLDRKTRDDARVTRARGRYGRRPARRSRRHARRARPLVQDEFLRRLGTHPAGRARTRPLSRAPRGDASLAGRRAANDRRVVGW